MRSVLHVMEQLANYGGSPRVLFYLAMYHDPKETRFIFVTYKSSALQREFEKNGVEVINLATLTVWRLVREIVKVVRHNEADIIVTHHTRPLLVGCLAAKITGLPFIHHEHSSAYYHTKLGRILTKWFLPFTSVVVCNSHYTAKTICDAYGLKKEQVRVFYNPVEEREVTKERVIFREENGIGREAIVIGHIGGMIPARDQTTLIKAFCRVHERFPDSHLLLIGDGPLRGNLEALTKELELSNCVTFTGYTNDIGDYLNVIDIYVNSTLDEGFGIAVVEAMLAGKPVVLANAGAHPELIVDGEHGQLYQGGDAKALESVLIMLIQNPELRQRIGAAARKMAHDRFAPDRYAIAYCDFIEKVIRSKTNRRWFIRKQG
jgi:glycosyltransferase involved in cell wall biosynthesis